VRKHIHTACLFLLALVAAGTILVHLRSVLIPFVLAMGLFYSLVPIVDMLSDQTWQRTPRARSPRAQGGKAFSKKKEGLSGYDSDDYKYGNEGAGGAGAGAVGVVPPIVVVSESISSLLQCRLPRPMAVVVALMFACVLIAMILVVIFSSVNELAAHAERYSARVRSMADWVIRWGKLMGMDISNQGIAEKLLHHSAFLSEMVVKSVSLAVEEMTNGFLMLLFTVYLLLGYASSPPDEKRVSGVRAEIDMQVKRYIGFKVLLSTTTGIVIGISLLILKVDLALVFGLLAGLLNFIPNVGGVISTLLPMPVVIFDPSKTWLDIFLAFAIPSFVHAVTGNIIEPRVLGGAMDLHPVVVLLSLMLWGSLWGVVGMILSVPITAVIKICLQSLDHPLPRFLAGMFEGRVESPGEPSFSYSQIPSSSVEHEMIEVNVVPDVARSPEDIDESKSDFYPAARPVTCDLS